MPKTKCLIFRTWFPMPAFPNNTESLVKKTTAKTIRGPIGRLKCAEALVFRDILGLPPAAGDFVYQVYRVSQKNALSELSFCDLVS